MSLQIQLLGLPHLRRDGSVVRPRGRKTWALLAYLLLTETEPHRRHVAEVFFPLADDPLAALRWTLSDLRRLLGKSAVLQGDPLRLVLPPDSVVDSEVLTSGTWFEAVRLGGLGRDLIEGQDLSPSPDLELWLVAQRRRMSVAAESVLREAAMACMSSGELQLASEYARRLVSLNPYDENHHVLLIRTLSVLGAHSEAVRHADYATDFLRREMGVDPSSVLRSAVREALGDGARKEATPAVLARLEAGEAAVAAGALEAGLASLRHAVDGARLLGDRQLLARTLIALGSALVHAARGSDEEGATALYEGATLAEECDSGVLAALALRELAWIEFLRARNDRARNLLAEASVFAAGNESELAWLDLIRGAGFTDSGDYAAGFRWLHSALDQAMGVGGMRVVALAEAHIGRWHLLRGELVEAREALHRSTKAALEDGWTTFLPWPESLLADTDLRAGDVDSASSSFEHAFALGCQIGDPCWESIAARGLGLVAEAQGDVPGALKWLEEATRRCRRLPDSWLWVEGYALDALCRVAVDHRSPSASGWIGELESLAARAGLRELLVRAYMHEARMGNQAAARAAGLLTAEIENPALIAELAGSTTVK